MESEMTRDLIANVVPAIAAPTARVLIDHHYSSKIREDHYSHELQMAEMKAEMMENAFGDPEPEAAVEAGSPATVERVSEPERVYDGLRQLRDRTTCGFCHAAADALAQSDLDLASKGLTELRQYEQLIERAKTEGLSPEETEAEIYSMIHEQWEAVPRVMSGV